MQSINNSFFGKELDREIAALHNAFERSADQFEYFQTTDDISAQNSGEDEIIVFQITASNPSERPLAFISCEVDGSDVILVCQAVASPPAGAMRWEVVVSAVDFNNNDNPYLNPKINYSVNSNVKVELLAEIIRRVTS